MTGLTVTAHECWAHWHRASGKPKKREAVCRFGVPTLYTRKQAARSAVIRGSATPRLWETRLRAQDRVQRIASLQEFFKDSVAAAMAKQGVAADDHTAYYVVNLLTLFARHE